MAKKKFKIFKENKEDKLFRIKALRSFGTVDKGDIGGFVEYEGNLSHDGECWIHDNASATGASEVKGDAKLYDNSHLEDSTIKDRARMFDDAFVGAHSYINGDARISDNSSVRSSTVYGESIVEDRAIVESSVVQGDSVIADDSNVINANIDNMRIDGASIIEGTKLTGKGHIYRGKIHSKTDYIIFSNVGSEDGVLTAYRTDKGISVTRGCFTGTLQEFKDAVDATHGNNKHAKLYKSIIETIKIHFGLEEEGVA